MTDRYPKLKEHFKDYDISTLPDIPATWKDVSWMNDTCPSFQPFKDFYGLTVFTDYEKPEDREDRIPRYSVLFPSGDGEDTYTSDSWEDILCRLAVLKMDLDASRTAFQKSVYRCGNILFYGATAESDSEGFAEDGMTIYYSKRDGYSLMIENRTSMGGKLSDYEAELFEWAVTAGRWSVQITDAAIVSFRAAIGAALRMTDAQQAGGYNVAYECVRTYCREKNMNLVDTKDLLVKLGLDTTVVGSLAILSDAAKRG